MSSFACCLNSLFSLLRGKNNPTGRWVPFRVVGLLLEHGSQYMRLSQVLWIVQDPGVRDPLRTEIGMEIEILRQYGVLTVRHSVSALISCTQAGCDDFQTTLWRSGSPPSRTGEFP